MSESDDRSGRKVPSDDQRTVFVPSKRGRSTGTGDAPTSESGPIAETGAEPLEDDWGPEEGSPESRTEWLPQAEEGAPRPSDPPAAQVPAGPPISAPGTGTAGQTAIKIGDCLNHIYEVKRFIARGGMGEVFEGVNVTSDERVAIKVMLPSLAADPNVIAMFRREARSMTRLQHEALVQYRVLAQEPQLGILYIVTDFIDGTPLCDVLGTLKPSPDQLEMLLRRLASGLRVAHQLGVLHRDISPDNVLLESGKIERAKIVDFGIAKDLTPGSGTIIGEGFAGKLGYVAPEQLGDFNRELGPWTDVYSLALVLTAAAVGHDLKMGGTLVDAVDRRRKGVDLTGVPEALRPVFAAMLRPNPAERLRSMDEVLAMLDAARRPSLPPVDGDSHGTKLPRYAPIAGVVAAVVLLGGVTVWLTSGSHKSSPSTQASQSQAVPHPGVRQAGPAAAADPVETARSAIESVVPSIGCSWLDVVSITGGSDQLNVVLGGVARDPSDAQAEVDTALRSAGLPNTNLDAASVAPIEPGGCAAIDAYRQIQNTGAPRLSTKQRIWNMHLLKSGDYKGQQGAQPIIRLTIADPKSDMTLFGIEPSGVISELLNSRQHLNQAVAAGNPTKVGDDAYELKMDLNHQGWSGLILITGKGPFPPNVVRPGLGARDMAWREHFANVAAQQGWRADMLWFKVDSQRGGD